MRNLTLTRDHVMRVHNVVEDHGLATGAELHTNSDYDSWVKRMIENHPPKTPTRLFAYGSLIWKPEIEHVGEQPASLGVGIAPSASG